MTNNNKTQTSKTNTSVKGNVTAAPAQSEGNGREAFMTFWQRESNKGGVAYAACQGEGEDAKWFSAFFSTFGEGKATMSIVSFDEAGKPTTHGRLTGKMDSNNEIYYAGKAFGKSLVAFPNLVTPTAGKRAGMPTAVITVLEAISPTSADAFGKAIEAVAQD